MPKSRTTLHPAKAIIKARLVDTFSASHPKALAPGTATNWMITIVAMLKARDMPIVSAAKAPAIAKAVWIPSLNRT